MDYTLNKQDRARSGNSHPQLAPHGCFRCQGDDNWIAICVGNEMQWKRFLKVVRKPELKDKKFAFMQSRLENQSELDRLIEEWTVQQDKFDLMRVLQKSRIPAGALLSMKEVNLSPQLKQRGYFSLIDHGNGIGKRPIPTQIPARFQGFNEFTPKRAPHFSEDTGYVLGSLLGMSEQDIRRLENDKITSSLPTFPSGRPTRLDLIEKQQAAAFDPNYLQELNKHFGTDIGSASDD
jgi:crotonobetainyl-CoA:carnitine CoA-transferase CaiB-like acyl-CoA transferase